MITLTPLFLV